MSSCEMFRKAFELFTPLLPHTFVPPVTVVPALSTDATDCPLVMVTPLSAVAPFCGVYAGTRPRVAFLMRNRYPKALFHRFPAERLMDVSRIRPLLDTVLNVVQFRMVRRFVRPPAAVNALLLYAYSGWPRNLRSPDRNIPTDPTYAVRFVLFPVFTTRAKKFRFGLDSWVAAEVFAYLMTWTSMNWPTLES